MEREGFEIKRTTIKGINDTWILGLKFISEPSERNERELYPFLHRGLDIDIVHLAHLAHFVIDLLQKEPTKRLSVEFLLQEGNKILTKNNPNNPLLITDELLKQGNFEGRWFGYEKGYINLI